MRPDGAHPPYSADQSGALAKSLVALLRTMVRPQLAKSADDTVKVIDELIDDLFDEAI
jgi:hypothetical protein